MNGDAHGINDLGHIAGSGTIGRQTHAFLLTPISVPEPASLSLSAVSCLVLLARRRRQKLCGDHRRSQSSPSDG
jgi:hypothetical protein